MRADKRVIFSVGVAWITSECGWPGGSTQRDAWDLDDLITWQAGGGAGQGPAGAAGEGGVSGCGMGGRGGHG